MKSEKIKNQRTKIVITKKQKNGKQNDKKEKKIKEQITKTPMKNLNDKRKTLKRKAIESDSPKDVFNKKQKVDDRTVFVGNVPVNTTENDLKEFFSSYGEVKNARIYSYAQSRYELKSTSARVNFILPESAVKAKEANGKILNNFHIRVGLKNEWIKYDPETTIFLSNVPIDTEEEDVRKIFKDCGNVNMVNLSRNIKNNFAIGYVNFDSANAVDLALKLGTVQIGNRKVRIIRYNDKDRKKNITKNIIEEKKDLEKFQIIVPNMPEKTIECDLHELFGKCGRITSTRIVHKDITFCYVNFEDSEGVQNAVKMQNPKLHGVPIDIKTKKIRVQQPVIYIKNLPLNTTNKQIFEIFKDCGAITGITLHLKKHKRNGVGFVNFQQEDAIEKALKKIVYLGINKLLILGKKNKSKDDKEDSEEKSDLTTEKNDDDVSDAEENEDDENGDESDDDEENGDESDDDEKNGDESDDDEKNGDESDDDEKNGDESDDDEKNGDESGTDEESDGSNDE